MDKAIEKMRDQMGWDAESMLALLYSFIEEEKLVDKLAHFIRIERDERWELYDNQGY